MRARILYALCAFFCAWVANATDLTTGYSFSSGEQNVTHTKLNNAVNNATINTGFFTDKSAATTPSSSDLALIYSSADTAYRKITLGNLFLGNAALITGQSEDTTPSSADFLLTYDVSATALKKATLLNSVFENAALIANRTNWNTPDGDNFYLGYNGAWNKTARSNLWYQFWNYRTSDFTNLATHTAPTNSDALVISTWLSVTNRQIPLINLFSNFAPATSLGPTNVFPGVVGTNLATVSMNSFSNYFRTNLVQTFTTSEGAVAAGSVINVAHGLPSTPQTVRWVLRCKTAENSFAIGDEVDVYGLYEFGVGDVRWLGGANTTNVWLSLLSTAASIGAFRKDTGAATALTAGNWRAVGYATYRP